MTRRVIIYSDSQAALQALQSSFTTSKIVRQCIASLNALGSSVHVLLRYVQAHSGWVGNEMADYQAKLAVRQPRPYLSPLIPLAKSHYNRYITHALTNLWTQRWQDHPDCQTKAWFPAPSPAKSKYILSQPREVFSRAVRFLTGHCFLRRQRLLTDVPAPSITCRLCGHHRERAIHILTSCDTLQPLRITFLGTPKLSSSSPSWQPRNLLAFIACPRISDLEKDE